ncbi:hypothetical protein A3C91_01710 [Candidatus Azambacteria bacterium RIFCSPHIGHO2_02_FULL_52_12]|uniref:Aspartyl/glutamyl-tRNA(Asn/Gln) amidotransferase subunit C n=1 Tax=Candidatus Azambacteria bacterium RIFCSPLOWO2_01_FULL_46_25 TaxID=1797298 RepID=A0A1F5BVC8_9BACT|nr:MAG: hypothetical protein A3C91_01710 [Candidatus Azambacteria bacterium RIFCSPHIGHO2_02_FULL_52_12]OGD34562.1 MAG: hypothetical protein A2988_03570 [Candidatus Azambacteria bacterium RIFCSPLOWO2_01_FULL_46_25]OGD36436.1 MAG: hypothetical protein A2850_02070 [Candidatus Azambacteria bacterium RIFCSPHIGHO2_01_FULL_51_74]
MDIKTVQHIAKLSYLSVPDAELERFAKDLSAIISYVSELDGADTKGTQITAREVQTRNVMREDESKEKESAEAAAELVAAAPDSEDGYVKVKAIL